MSQLLSQSFHVFCDTEVAGAVALHQSLVSQAIAETQEILTGATELERLKQVLNSLEEKLAAAMAELVDSRNLCAHLERQIEESGRQLDHLEVSPSGIAPYASLRYFGRLFESNQHCKETRHHRLRRLGISPAGVCLKAARRQFVCGFGSMGQNKIKRLLETHANIKDYVRTYTISTSQSNHDNIGYDAKWCQTWNVQR